MPAPQHPHQAVEAGKAQQHIFAVLPVTGEVALLREIGQPVYPVSKAAGGRLVIHEMMAVKHIAHLFRARVAMRFGDETICHAVVLQQPVNIRFIEKAPVKIRNLLPSEPFAELVNIR
ncbi:hypothetical protein D3C75_1140120 [compost metagenome]